ncbi:MAG: YafY family protein [Legionella sp.]|nr:YafY family protein [Legionella sp.]
MSRTERLFELMQILRRHRYPVNGVTLAAELGVSLRTIYRDIATLQSQGAHIEGEPGLGFLLQPGFMLPPLMFSEEEIEALVLGSRWVAMKTDSKLKIAARNALAKISAVLPSELRYELDANTLLIGPNQTLAAGDEEMVTIREAIRAEQKLHIQYLDLKEQNSERTIWPFALGFFDGIRIVIAWCELRGDYRHFRTDRIQKLDLIPMRYPKRRQILLKKWREINGIPSQ